MFVKTSGADCSTGNHCDVGNGPAKRPLRAAGLIGSLSLALGVGAAVASMPLAAAESPESASASDSTSTRESRGPAREAARANGSERGATTAPARRDRVATTPSGAATERASVKAASTVSGAPELPSGDSDPAAPVTAPLAWAAAAVSRRELSVQSSAVAAPAATATAAAATAGVGEFRDVFEGQVRGYVVRWGGTAALADAVAPLVADAAAGWINNGTVGPQLTGLASNAAVRAFIADWTTLQLNSIGLPGQVSGAVGAAVADAVRVAFGDPANTALIGAVDTFIAAVPWTSAPLADTLSALTSGSTTVLSLVERQLDSQAVWTAATALLANPAVPQALGTGVTTLVGQVAADAGVQSYLRDRLGAFITGNQSGVVGTAITGVVNGLLADPALIGALAGAAGTTVTALLSQPGIPALAISAVQQIVVGDASPASVLGAVAANPVVQGALNGTLLAAATELLANPAVPQALGDAAGTLVTALAADPAFRALIADQLGGVLDTTADLGALLTDPAVIDALGAAAGTTVTAFLAQPGLAAALAGGAAQIIGALLTGSDPATALAALQSSPELQAAVNATLPTLVNSLLAITALRQAVSATAGELISDAIGGSGADGSVAGTVTDAVVDSLLGDPAVGTLLSTVLVEAINGTSSTETVNALVTSVLRDPELQTAVGTAIGKGVGALFGDNPVGAVVGWVVGGAATLAIRVFAGITLLFNPGFTLVPPAAAEPVLVGSGGSVFLLVAAA